MKIRWKRLLARLLLYLGAIFVLITAATFSPGAYAIAAGVVLILLLALGVRSGRRLRPRVVI